MWVLFLVCVYYYCSAFKQCTTGGAYDRCAGGKKVATINYNNRIYLLCVDFEITDEITKPGYLCNGLTTSSVGTELNRTKYYKVHAYTEYYWCVDYKIIPYSTPEPTQTPQQPLKVPSIKEKKGTNLLVFLITLIE